VARLDDRLRRFAESYVMGSPFRQILWRIKRLTWYPT